MGAFLVDVNLLVKNVLGLEQVKQQIAAVTANVPVGVGGAAGGIAGAKAAGAQAIAIATAQTVAINKLAAAKTKLATSSKKATTAIGKTTAATKKGGAAAQNFGQQIGLAGKRYLAFVTATAVPFAALGALREAIGAVIDFDEAVTRVRQITGQTAEEISGLRQDFIDLSIATGASAIELAKVSKTLAQAGIRGEELKKAMVSLSKVKLTPTFGSMEEAVQGYLAVQNQFENESLEMIEIFDVLTNVGNEFAATADDLFQGFARGGAAFQAVGGTFREFAAALAVVRQETRESASTVGTFFKTLSSRLADPKILEFLRGKGIELVGETGEFIGAIPAIKEIAKALEEVATTQDKIEIATRVSGRRQVSRFLALTSSVDELNKALKVSESSAGAFNRIAGEGLTTLRAQLDIMVAKFNELFQELAQPVFVPLIKGFTAAATGAAALISAVSPIIPIFTQIVGFAAGIKLLSLSLGAVAKAAQGLAALRLAGLSGLASAGLVAAQTRQPAGFVGPINQIGGGAALAGIGASIKNTGTALIKSQLGQIAILGIGIAALDSFSDKVKEAGDTGSQLAIEFVKAISFITIGVSLVTKQTALGIAGKVLFGSLTTQLLGLAGVLGTGIFVAGRIASEAISQKAKEAADQIKNIDINIDDGLDEEIGILGKSIIGKIREAGDKFRDTKTGKQSLQQFFLEFGSNLSGLFTGQRGLTGPAIDTQKFIDEALDNSQEKIDEFFTAAVTEFGLNFREGLLADAKKAGLPPEFGQQLVNTIIGRVSESTKVSAISQATAAKQGAAQQKIAQQAENLAARLSKISVPSQLSSQLDALSESVRRTVTSIDNNISAFDALTGVIGTLQAPDVGFDISEKAIKGFLKDPNALGNLLGDSFGDLSEETQNVVLFRDVLTKLGKAFSASKADFEKTIDLDDPQADPAVFVKDVIDKFIAGLEDVPPSVIARLEAAGQRITSAVAQNILPEEGVFEAIHQAFLGELVGVGDETAAQIENILEGSLRAVGNTLDREEARLKELTSRVSDIGIAEAFDELLGDIGSLRDFGRIDFRLGDVIGQVEGISEALVGSNEFFNQYADASRTAAETTVALTEAIKTTGANIPAAADAWLEANKRFLQFKAIAQESLEAIDRALAGIDPESFNAEARKIDLIELRKRIEDELAKVQVTEAAQATALAKGPVTFETAVGLFGTNVEKYRLATEALVAGLKIPLEPEKVTPGVAGGGPGVDVGKIIDVSAPGAISVRILNTGEIAAALERTPQDVTELNKAAFGVENIQSLFAAFEDTQKQIRESRQERGLLALPETQVFEEALELLTNKTIKTAEATGDFAGNLENLPKNIPDLLLGKLDRPGVAPAQLAKFDPGTREVLQARSEFRDVETSANAAKASAAEAAASAERAAVVAAAVEAARSGVAQPTRLDLSSEGRNAEALEAIKQSLDKIPQQQVIDLTDIKQVIEQRDADDQISALDPAQLESSLTGAITTALSTTLPTALQPILEQGEVTKGPAKSAEEVSEAANQLANATQATQETAAGIVAGGELLQTGTQNLASVAEGLSTGINELAAVVDVQREALAASDTTEIASATNELAETNRANIEAIKQQNESLVGLNEKLDQRIAQVESPEPIPIEDITIEGLEEANVVTETNSEVLASNNESLGALQGELSKTQQALNEGLTAKVESAQTIQVDVRGLEDVVDSHKEAFAEVARDVAREQIRIALNELSDTLGNQELSQNARSVADGLA